VIDILMPFYGDPDQFRQAVQSVRRQSSDRWHLRIRDDLYPDDFAVDWVNRLKDPRITAVRNTSNLGVSRNFQACLDDATAPWVTFMGCDDLMHPRYVEVVEEAAARSRAAMIQPRVAVIDEAGRRATPVADRIKRVLMPRGAGVHTLAGEALAARLLTGNWAYFPAICWRREVIAQRGFAADLELVLDLDLILALLEAGESFELLDQELFAYRRHAASASSAAAGDAIRFAEEKAFFLDAEVRMQELGWQRAARAARWHATSRFHAASLMPGAAMSKNRRNVRRLWAHVTG
jgi:glycosyltransferase involved in cell wall biosynthesis